MLPRAGAGVWTAIDFWWCKKWKHGEVQFFFLTSWSTNHHFIIRFARVFIIIIQFSRGNDFQGKHQSRNLSPQAQIAFSCRLMKPQPLQLLKINGWKRKLPFGARPNFSRLMLVLGRVCHQGNDFGNDFVGSVWESSRRGVGLNASLLSPLLGGSSQLVSTWKT